MNANNKNNKIRREKTMGIGNVLRSAGYTLATNASVARAIPHIRKVVQSYSKEELHKATETEESKKQFGLEVYDKLPASITAKMDKEWFSSVFAEKMNEMLGVKSIKKKLDKEKNKRKKKLVKKHKK